MVAMLGSGLPNTHSLTSQPLEGSGLQDYEIR